MMANLEFRYGAMNSGKSMALLQMAYNYEENDKRILVVKSVIDTKGEDYLVSRIGPKRKVDIKLDANESLLDDKYKSKLEGIEAILVDEAQFLTSKQVESLWYISKILDISVICFGLKTDFTTNLFEGSKRLLELSDKFKELETICKCGVKARFNARKINGKYVLDGDTNLIDGSNDTVIYEPLCGTCYLKNVLKK